MQITQVNNVAVLGASPKRERYANMAIRLLLQNGFTVFPVHPHFSLIEDLPVYADLSLVPAFHTLTVYVNAERQMLMREAILNCGAKRVIFNPGTENPALANELKKRGLEIIEDCTLVMLNSHQF